MNMMAAIHIDLHYDMEIIWGKECLTDIIQDDRD